VATSTLNCTINDKRKLLKFEKYKKLDHPNYRVGNYKIYQPPKGLLLKKSMLCRIDVFRSKVFEFEEGKVKNNNISELQKAIKNLDEDVAKNTSC
jgi:hypothetical protein